MALAYRDGQACTAATGSAPDGASFAVAAPRRSEVLIPKSPWHTNRIMLP